MELAQRKQVCFCVRSARRGDSHPVIAAKSQEALLSESGFLKLGRGGTKYHYALSQANSRRGEPGRPSHKAPVLLHASAYCTHPRELFLDAFVAAVDVIHAVVEGFTPRDERGQHERRAGAQVRSDHCRAE